MRGPLIAVFLTFCILCPCDPVTAGICRSSGYTCSHDPQCTQSPTSIQPVSTTADADDGYWAGTPCGTMTCSTIKCPCGRPFGKGVCPDSSAGRCTGSEADWTVRDFSLDEISKRLFDGAAAEPEIEVTGSISTVLPPSGAALTPAMTKKLAAWVEFLGRLRSVNMRATVALHLPSDSASGTYHYSAAGTHYRVQAELPRHLSIPFINVAYNGERETVVDVANSSMTLFREPHRNVATFPNPFFLAVQFMSEEGDGCSFCGFLAPSQLGRPADRLAELFRSSFVGAKEAGDQVFYAPGTHVNGVAFYYRVQLDPKLGLPTTVDQVRIDGKGLLWRFESRDYRPVAGARGLLFPRQVVLTTYDESREVSAVRYQITELVANARIPKSAFTLPTEDVDVVIDSRTRKVLKHPQTNPATWRVP